MHRSSKTLCNGFDLTGKLPASNHFSQKFRPAALPTTALRGVADRARGALLATVKSLGDRLVDEGVLNATFECDLEGEGTRLPPRAD